MNGVLTLSLIISIGTPFDLSKRGTFGKSSLRPFDFGTYQPVVPYRSKVTTTFAHVALGAVRTSFF